MTGTLLNKRIFCVESQAHTRDIVQLVLGHAGAVVAVDRWGFAETALPKLAAFAPDLVLLEWRATPYRRVCEVYSALRHIEALQSVPVILLASSPLQLDLPVAQAYGIAGVLPTPLNAQTLAADVLAMLATPAQASQRCSA